MSDMLNRTEDEVNLLPLSQASLPHNFSTFSLQPENMPEPSVGAYSSRVQITQKLKPASSQISQRGGSKTAQGSASSKKLRTIHSTERLYYRDSINRMLKRNQVLEQKQEEERKLIQNMRP